MRFHPRRGRCCWQQTARGGGVRTSLKRTTGAQYVISYNYQGFFLHLSFERKPRRRSASSLILSPEKA